MTEPKLSRLKFLTSAGVLFIGSSLKLQGLNITESKGEKIIDIHQHVHYAGRTNEQLIAHQQNMGVSKTILQPSGTPADLASTHFGKGNGLQADAWGNGQKVIQVLFMNEIKRIVFKSIRSSKLFFS